MKSAPTPASPAGNSCQCDDRCQQGVSAGGRGILNQIGLVLLGLSAGAVLSFLGWSVAWRLSAGEWPWDRLGVSP